MKRGFNHIDLATKDMAATRAFYEGILGFPAVRADIIEFEAGSLENLVALKAALEAKGVAVRGPEDHEGWCHSIYFMDPNGLQLEYCWVSRELTPDDARAQVRFRVSREGRKLPA